MIDFPYPPQNKMQEKILQRRLFRGIIHIFCIIGIIMAMVISLPETSFAFSDVSSCPAVTASQNGGVNFVVWINESGACRLYVDPSPTSSAFIRVQTGYSFGSPAYMRIFSPSYPFSGSCLQYTTSGASWGSSSACANNDAILKVNSALDPTVYTLIKSDINDIYSASGGFNPAYGSWVGKYSNGQLIYSIFDPTDATLEILTSSPYLTNQFITFRLTYTDLDFVPSFLNFFNDSGATLSTQYTFLAQSNSGIFEFQYRYPFSGSGFTPYATVTDFGTSSITTNILSPITIIDRNSLPVTPLSTSSLNVDRINLIDGESAHFTWDLNGFCDGSSVTDQRLFRGYPQYMLAFEHGGTPIGTGSTGSGDLVYSALEVPYYPYIEVECADSSIEPKLYLGSATSPIGIRVLTQAQWDSEDAGTGFSGIQWATGGGSPGFWTGSGGYFFMTSNPNGFFKYENVPLKWNWNADPGFPVDSVWIYSDPSLLPNAVIEDTSASSTEDNIDHYANIVYYQAGTYQPAIELRSASYSSSSGATFKRFYLGGGFSPSSRYAVKIFDNVAALQSGSGASTCSQRGIFGIAPQNFTLPFATSNNGIIASAQEILTKGVSGLLWIGGNVMCIIDNAPLVSTLHEIVAPEPGVRYMPNSFQGHEFKPLWQHSTITISYADDDAHDLVWSWLIIFIQVIAVMAYIDILWPHRRPHHHPKPPQR